MSAELTIYVALICDRHVDPNPVLFDSMAGANLHARNEARSLVHDEQDIDGSYGPDGLYYASCGEEGDYVMVLKREVQS